MMRLDLPEICKATVLGRVSNVMLDVPLGLAFTAGMVASVNPCGFAMLPAYLGFFVGSDANASRGRALVVSAAMTSGFLVVFGLVGLAVETVASSLDQYLAKATIVIGLGLVLIGAWLLAGRELRVRTPKIEKGGGDRGFWSMFWFGVSYATASLSCTLGPFLVALTPTFRSDGVASGVLAFVAYSLGMGSVITLVTVAVGGARSGLVARLRRSAPIINRVSGAMLVIAGAYVTWYGIWDVRGDFDEDPILDGAARIQEWLTRRLSDIEPGFALGALALAVLGGVALEGRRRRGRSRAEAGKASTPERVPAS